MSHTLFATYSGRVVNYNEMTTSDIRLLDIAHHLTNIQRYGGCLPFHKKYSVASHSINCYKMATKLFPHDVEVHRAALMHDAPEAYLGDVVSGLKQCLPDYKKLESKVENIINDKYNLQIYSRVADIDKRIMLNEVLGLLPETYHLYFKNQNYIPYPDLHIESDGDPAAIKHEFLSICKELNIHD